MKKTILSLVIGLTITSCAVAELPNLQPQNENKLSETPRINLKESLTSIKGKIEFPEKFKIKADQKDIATQATVSIIVPVGMVKANSTIAVGLTDNNGNFKINPDVNFQPQIGSVYVLEARKRLGGEGNSVLTLKTFIKWTASGWTSITGGNVYINTKTTALAIISSYNSNFLNPNQTIGKLNIINGLVVAGDIIDSFKAQDLINAENAVILALNNNQDPTEKIKYSNNALVFPQNLPTPTPTSTPTSNSGSSSGGGSGGVVNFPIIYNASKVTQSGLSGLEEDNFSISGSYLSNSSVIVTFLIDSKSLSRTITPVSNDGYNLLFTIPRLTDNEIRYLYNLPSGGDVSNINRTLINISFAIHNGNGPSQYINFNDVSANPVPSPSPTPLPTATPVSTPTPLITPTPIPTITPLPIPTPVPVPSNYSYSIVSTGYLNRPRAIDLKDDKIYVFDLDRTDPDAVSGRITIMDLSGNVITKIKRTSSGYLSSLLDSIVVDDGKIWLIGPSISTPENNFFSFSTDGTPIQSDRIYLPNTAFQSLAVDAENKRIYVSAGFNTKAILKFNYDSNFMINTSEPFQRFAENIYTISLATDKYGNVYSSDMLSTETVKKFNKDGLQIAALPLLFRHNIYDIAIDPNNFDIYVLAVDSGLFRYDKEGNFINSYAADLLNKIKYHPSKIVVGSDSSIYVTLHDEGKIIKITPFN